MTVTLLTADFVSVERCSREVGHSRYRLLKLLARGNIRTLVVNTQLMVNLPDVREALEAVRQQGEPVCAGDYHRRG